MFTSLILWFNSELPPAGGNVMACRFGARANERKES
jgi:hypothetical protein